MLIDTVEDYQQEVGIDRELYQVIALDAKGVAQSRITARRAANLLRKATRAASYNREHIDGGRVVPNKRVRFKASSRFVAQAH